LTTLRTSFATAPATTHHNSTTTLPFTNPRLKQFPIPRLDELVNRHFRATQSAPLAVSGRYHELLYVLIATLIAPPHQKAVTIVDIEGQFDALRLLTTTPFDDIPSQRDDARTQQSPITRRLRPEDLDHVYVLRYPHGNSSQLSDCLASIEDYMLYGSHRSRDREWWGTILIGTDHNTTGSALNAGSAPHVAVTAGWKGWLRVDRSEIATFADLSLEEALADRDERQDAVNEAGWVASSPWGRFTFGDRKHPSN